MIIGKGNIWWIGGSVGLLNWVFPSWFWPALQYVDNHYKENNFVLFRVVVSWVLGSTSLMCSIVSPSNGFVWFSQLIIHNTKLILPSVHAFFFTNIAVGYRCRKKHHSTHDLLFYWLSYLTYDIKLFPYFWIFSNHFKLVESLLI